MMQTTKTLTAPLHAGTHGKMTHQKSPNKLAKCSGHLSIKTVYSTQTINSHSQGKQVAFLFQKFNTYQPQNLPEPRGTRLLALFQSKPSFRVPHQVTYLLREVREPSTKCVIQCVCMNCKIRVSQHNAKEFLQSPSLFGNFCKYTFDSLNMFSFLDQSAKVT